MRIWMIWMIWILRGGEIGRQLFVEIEILGDEHLGRQRVAVLGGEGRLRFPMDVASRAAVGSGTLPETLVFG